MWRRTLMAMMGVAILGAMAPNQPVVEDANLAERGASSQAITGWLAECGQCYQQFGGGWHEFNGSSCGEGGYLCMDCDAFNACHQNAQNGSCSEWHWRCGGGDLDAASLAAAIERGDTQELRATLVAGRAWFNAERKSLQGFDCRGRVAINIHLPSTVVAELVGAG